MIDADILDEYELKAYLKCVKDQAKEAWRAIGNEYPKMKIKFIDDIVSAEKTVAKLETILRMQGVHV